MERTGRPIRPDRRPRAARRGGLWAAGCALACSLGLEAGAPRPPVFPALELGLANLDPGERLLAELHCTACHAAEPAVAARLRPPPAPLLGQAGTRLRPGFLRGWLRDPLTTKPGTTMPDVLGGLAEAERTAVVEELTHYLASLAPANPAAPFTPAAGALVLQQGRALYHQIGCVACHAPFEAAAAVFSQSVGAPTDPDALRYTLARLQETSTPLPDLAAKYRPGALAAFLADPLTARPGGRMPSLNLTEAEARVLAAYLGNVTGNAVSNAPVETAFEVNGALARRGRERFAELGCAACHELGNGLPAVPSRLSAPPLDLLDVAAAAGCLAETPRPPAPRYLLSTKQREALRTTLRELARLRQPPTPAERVAHTLAGLNCTACHSRDGLGGPSPARSDYFTSLSDADLGDEGRIPPHLSGVGGKLRAAWLDQVLTNRGAVRPYQAMRMPQFGPANVGHLTADFRAADAWPEPVPPAVGDAAAGRALVGLGGYGCIQCHSFGPHPSLGVSVMDMTRMAGRLEWGWFRRYLLDPPGLRPGTRMPSFWPEGKATVPTILAGDTEKQIAAIWAYLSLGAEAVPPPGLLEAAPKAGAGSKVDYE
jgi:mono/diheme cytochrome c family protein